MIRKQTKKMLSSPVRVGFLAVPLLVTGAVFLAKKLNDRKRRA